MDSFSAATNPPSDQHIRCPHCDYNLTGLPHDICPECGQPFDRERLLRDTLLPVHPWDEPGTVLPFLKTCYAVWVHPAAFARKFPRRHNPRSAWRFSLICYAIALPIVLLPQFLLLWSPQGPIQTVRHFLRGLATFAIPVLAGPIMCEAALALCFSVSLYRRSKYQFWRGITHFFGAHWILSVIGWALFLNKDIINNLLLISNDYVWYAGMVIMGITFLLWWMGLARALSTKADDRDKHLVGLIIAIPIVSGFIILVAIAIGVATMIVANLIF